MLIKYFGWNESLLYLHTTKVKFLHFYAQILKTYHFAVFVVEMVMKKYSVI